MSSWLNKFQPCGALILRIVLAVSLLHYGYQKVHSHAAMEAFTHQVQHFGLPYWLAYVSAFTEVVGGIMMILGLFTRLFAALIAINMLTALFTVAIHRDFNTCNYVIALAAIALMLLFYGAGSYALDRRINFA
jgi:putative oxidoreductase